MAYVSSREMGSTRAPPTTLHSMTASNPRARPTPKPSHGNLASPTESESSDAYDAADSVR